MLLIFLYHYILSQLYTNINATTIANMEYFQSTHSSFYIPIKIMLLVKNIPTQIATYFIGNLLRTYGTYWLSHPIPGRVQCCLQRACCLHICNACLCTYAWCRKFIQKKDWLLILKRKQTATRTTVLGKLFKIVLSAQRPTYTHATAAAYIVPCNFRPHLRNNFAPCSRPDAM